MTFSQEWETRFLESGGMSLWPWSDLISQFKRHVRGDTAGLKVLELGCAKGANVPFFLSMGADYHGIEGSPAMAADLLDRHPRLRGKIAVGDFTRDLYFSGGFDVIVDRSSLTHNGTKAIRHCLELVHTALKPGGRFIGIDWFSTAHSDYPFGNPDEDAYSKKAFPSGQFQGVGRVHFSDRNHLEDLFRDFRLDAMEHKVTEKQIPAPACIHAVWSLVATKSPKAVP
jgi:SAM-dependent methyltransferase